MRTRRTIKPEFKAKVVLECISGEKSVSEVCREYQLSPVLVSKWRMEFIDNSAIVFENNKKDNKDQEHIEELERMLGRLTLENDMLKKASSILHAQNRRNGK